MAYPVITDIFRAQVVMIGTSGMPDDVFVNNWYFRNDNLVDPTYEDLADAVEAVLNAAYGTANGTATNALAYYISSRVTSVQYKIYDLGIAAPRYPIVPAITASWQGRNATVIPQEVAVCLSFRGGPGPRQRGRVYLGPFNEAALNGSGNRPDEDLIADMGQAAINVMNTSEDVTWVAVSPTGASSVVVTEAWVDNELDTQRSRGLGATERTTWNASGEV